METQNSDSDEYYDALELPADITNNNFMPVSSPRDFFDETRSVASFTSSSLLNSESYCTNQAQ